MPTTDISSMVQPSLGSSLAFVAIVAILAALFVWASFYSTPNRNAHPSEARKQSLRATILIGTILGTTGFLAGSGLLMELANSPGLMLYFGGSNVLMLGLALSSWGQRFSKALPIWALVGYQGFRLPLELVLHRWYEEGVIPIQMTYSGYNFDIVTGIFAVVLAILIHRGYLGVRSAWFFNIVGLTLLVTVASIAVLSSPVPFRHFHQEPTVLLAFYFPYTWILSMCVGGALFGHVVLFRRLLSQNGGR